MGVGFVILGSSILALLLAGYLAQYLLPPPVPKILGIDLGTTYSCIGMYHAVSGRVDILSVQNEQQCIPSVVAFNESGVYVGYDAVAQAEYNPKNTIYDSKRFIGRHFTPEELAEIQKHYPFQMSLRNGKYPVFHINVNNNLTYKTPEEISSVLLRTLVAAADRNLSVAVKKVVISVPAEFDEMQRNYTRKSANLLGLQVMRIINEPTAAAMAYGFHSAPSLRYIIVVDLGGGTLDVSLLNVQGGMFLTLAMAGNNRLGGQDFNQRLTDHMLDLISKQFNKQLEDKTDRQTLRFQVEEAKLKLTNNLSTDISMKITSFQGSPTFQTTVTRQHFENLNADLFKKVLDPIDSVLKTVLMDRQEVHDVVLVGGSTRIPRVRELIKEYFNKDPNTSVEPELAVAIGVSIQAGILGGMWPLTVSAVEKPIRTKKIHIS
ncbi:heat shock 70 kDa protein 13 [Octopus sinensis]|uniref:Heat shock 70 kDa protein 13 n=1 Tax=Octopus sinensis TaxID=2607531 RepID=A0A6P7T5K7_9MOLL|nr:heat shock 70 kDa protein 13 [Octopus sinensis]